MASFLKQVQGGMGSLRGSHSHQYYDRGPSTGIPHTSSSSSFSNFSLSPQLSSTPKDPEAPSKSSLKEYYQKNLYSTTSFLLPSFSGSQKRQHRSSYNRPLYSQQISDHSHLQDGNDRENSSMHFSTHVGMHPGPPGCILPCSNQLVLPDFSSIYGRPSNICFSVPPFRTLSSPLDLFKSNKAYQGSYSHSDHKIPYLSRRLPDLVSDSRESSGPPLLHPVSSRDTWIPDKQTEISTRSFSDHRVSRSKSPSRFFTSFPSSLQGPGNYCPVPGNSPPKPSLSSSPRELSRSSKLCFFPNSSRSSSFKTNHHLDELSYINRNKRSSGSIRSVSQKTSSNLDRSDLLDLSSTHDPSNSLSSIDDRLFKEGLERNPPSSQNLRGMAKVIQDPTIQLVGTECNFPVSKIFSSPPKSSIRPNSFGQHNSSGLYSTPRDTQIKSPDGPVPISSRILSSPQHSFNSKTHKRNIKCSSRSGISSSSDLDRMETRLPDVSLANRTSGLDGSGSIRHSGESPNSLLRVPLPRPECSGHQCSIPPVEPLGLNISISSNCSSSQGLLSSPKVPRSRSVGCFIPCSVKLAPQSAPQISETHSSSRGLFVVPEHHQGHSVPPKSICFLPSRVDTMKIGLKSQGFDPEGTKMLLRSLKEGSTKVYQGAWRKCLSYLSRNNYSFKDTSVGTVCNFLTYEATVKNMQYRTLTGYRSALRLPILFGCGVEIVGIASNVFLKGLYSFNPPMKTKPMPIWNLNTLLYFLQSDRFEPLDSVSFLRLTEKTLCLILLASGRRIGEVANLSRIHHNNHSKVSIIMDWVPGFRAKNDNPGFQPPSPSMNFLISDNLSLCPVRAYNIYKEKSKFKLKNPPNIHSFLWVLPNTPDKLILKKLTSTFISVIKDALRDAELSIAIKIGPHQMRKLSASHAWKVGQDEEVIRENMGFASVNMRKNYIAKVPNLNVACVLPGGSFSPPMDESD